MVFLDFALNRIILELRYEEAFIYWDTCGSINLAIKAQFPSWKWDKTTTELSVFKEISKRLELTFNITNIKFVQDQIESLNQFKIASKEITPIIISRLNIAKFTRIGNRYIFVYPLKDIEQGAELIKKNKLIQISEEKLKIFGDDSHKSSYVIYLKNGDKQFRIELTTIERVEEAGIENINEKYFPKYGLRFDMDFSINAKIQANDFSLEDYIQSNYKFLENNLTQLVR